MFSFWTNLWELGWMINLQTEPFLNVFLGDICHGFFGDAAQAAACETLRAEMAAEQASFVNPIPLTWWIGSVPNQGFQVCVLDRRTYETYWIIFNSHAHHMYIDIYQEPSPIFSHFGSEMWSRGVVNFQARHELELVQTAEGRGCNR